jgi:hypothetical protein
MDANPPLFARDTTPSKNIPSGSGRKLDCDTPPITPSLTIRPHRTASTILKSIVLSFAKDDPVHPIAQTGMVRRIFLRFMLIDVKWNFQWFQKSIMKFI